MKMYPKTFSGQPAVQVESEFLKFLEFIKGRKVKSYLEIGTARGDTFHEIMINLPKGSKGVAVDMPEASWGLAASNKYLELAKDDLIQRGYDITIIYGNSQHDDIISKVKAHGKFDCVFIDGDHSYEGVMKDFLNYGALSNNIVALHDITDSMRPNRKGELIEVPVFWKDIKLTTKNKIIEFTEHNSTMGIGVTYVNP